MFPRECDMNKFGNLILICLVMITLLLCSLSQLKVFSVERTFHQTPIIPTKIIGKLHSGDIILREGNSFVSQVFRNFSQTEKHYSHSGLIYLLNGSYYVCHILAAEGKRSDKIRLEPLTSFCNTEDNLSWAIYRTEIDTNEIIKGIKEVLYAKIAFDTNFKLESDDKMYCTELVYKILTKANDNKKFINLTHTSGFDYVACDNLYLNPKTNLIYSNTY